MAFDTSQFSERDMLVMLLTKAERTEKDMSEINNRHAALDERIRLLEESRAGFTGGWKLLTFLMASPPVAAALAFFAGRAQ